MEITIGELVTKKNALEALVETKLSAIAAFRLAKDIRVINEELGNYMTANNDLIKKFGVEQEDKTFRIEENSPAMSDYLAEVKPLLEEKIQLNIQTISLSELGKDVSIEAKYMSDLMDFIITE